MEDQSTGQNNLFSKLSLILLVVAMFAAGAISDRLFVIKPLDYFIQRQPQDFSASSGLEQKILTEESVVISVAEKMSSSVVTVSIKTPRRRVLEYNPFDGGLSTRFDGGQPQDIGSGFVVSEDGLIITNKHVVSTEGAEYQVITQDGTEYEVEQISKDPSNDIAVLKINAADLVPVELGESSSLKVGQFVVAIGTALGEFRHTVTTGVISGLGRGITAGSAYEGYVERLDDVIQTDAAINPGNSGGPLLNSAGQVIGVNVAVASGAENVGFAIPIDLVKVGLDQFNETGKFVSKPYLGVEYQMIDQRTAILNDVPAGAYIVRVVAESPAENAGLQEDDIVVKFDGKNVDDGDNDLGDLISDKNAGDVVELEVWRNEETLNLTATLSEFGE